jgi:hypothetical protein
MTWSFSKYICWKKTKRAEMGGLLLGWTEKMGKWHRHTGDQKALL